jgi:hypothetical protein
MNRALEHLFPDLGEKFVGYLPNLLVGMLLILVGWFLGWLAKRLAIQVMVLLRLERFLVNLRWGEDFSKADVRFGFYNFVGNIVFLVLFLIFLNASLSFWRLTVLSDLLKDGILFLPKVIVSLVIFGFGWLASSWAARAVQRALRREEIPRSLLIARFSRTMLLIFFSAMAITELGIAREIVIIGFATIFMTLGTLAIVVAVIGGKDFLKKGAGPSDRESAGIEKDPSDGAPRKESTTKPD